MSAIQANEQLRLVRRRTEEGGELGRRRVLRGNKAVNAVCEHGERGHCAGEVGSQKNADVAEGGGGGAREAWQRGGGAAVRAG